jgi:hypothetical protein
MTQKEKHLCTYCKFYFRKEYCSSHVGSETHPKMKVVKQGNLTVYELESSGSGDSVGGSGQEASSMKSTGQEEFLFTSQSSLNTPKKAGRPRKRKLLEPHKEIIAECQVCGNTCPSGAIYNEIGITVEPIPEKYREVGVTCKSFMFYEHGGVYSVAAKGSCCCICDWTSAHKSNLYYAIRNHLRSKEHQVPLVVHQNLVQKQKFHCKMCNFYMAKSKMKFHLRIHEKDRFEVITEGDGIFDSLVTILVGEKGRDTSKEPTCEFCKQVHADDHIETVHLFSIGVTLEQVLDLREELLCPECNDIYDDVEDWKEHMVAVHSIDLELLVSEMDVDLGVSTTDGKNTTANTATNTMDLNTKPTTQTKEGLKLQCMFCPMESNTVSDLPQHRVDYHKLNPKIGFDLLFNDDCVCHSCLCKFESKKVYHEHLVLKHLLAIDSLI